jgi:circadian clock protein KaiB
MNPLHPSESQRPKSGPLPEAWHMRLYIAGWTPSSVAALRNVKILESEYLPPGSIVEVIDLLEHPDVSKRDHILAIPTLVRVRPEPVRRIVGNIGDLQKALKTLGFAAA